MLKINLKTIAGLFVAFVLFTATTAGAAWMATTSTKITKSSSSADVMWLQQTLNAVQSAGLVEDGKYGPKTTAAIKVFQAAHPASGSADGIAGPKTIAALNAAGANLGNGTYPAGCTSSTGFSTTTGMPCTGAVSSVPGCALGAMFSSTTGAPCTNVTTVNSGTNGYLADIATDSTNRVSTVYESEQDKVVAGMRATARLADQTVTRVRVTFKNNGTGSANLAKYISGASLWMDSTKLATMTVAQADRAISDDTYTFNFSGLNAKVAKDMIGRFYVSVNANGSLDTADTGAGSNFTVKFTSGGVNSSSPDGTYDTYPSSDLTQTGLSFGKFSANGVKAELGLAASNPAATVVTVNNTAATNAVTLLKFTVKATNSNLTLRKVPIQIVATGNNVSTMINTLKLYQGTSLLDSKDGSDGYTVAGSITTTPTTGATTTGYIFNNLSTPGNMITSGQTAEFSIVADLKQVSGNYAEGNTLTASFANADALLVANFGVLDANGDQLTAGATYRTGSAVGQVMTLRVNGVTVTQGAATITTGSASTAGVINSVTYSIPLTVTAFGQTQYVGQTAQFAATTSAQNALAFALQASTAPTTDVVAAPAGTGVTMTLASSDALIDGSGFRLDSGSAKHFTLQVILSCSTAADCTGASTANYRVQAKDIKTWTDNALTAGASVQSLLPQSNFQTGYQKIK